MNIDKIYEEHVLATGRSLANEYRLAAVTGPATRGLFPCHANIVTRLVSMGADEAQCWAALRRLVTDPTTNCPGVVEQGRPL